MDNPLDDNPLDKFSSIPQADTCPRDRPSRWHVDRTVNLSVVVGFLIWTLAGVWYASGMAERLTQVEHKVEAASPQSERITRLETKMDSIFLSLSEIKLLLRTPPNQR